MTREYLMLIGVLIQQLLFAATIVLLYRRQRKFFRVLHFMISKVAEMRTPESLDLLEAVQQQLELDDL